jgi:hypothetical protein
MQNRTICKHVMLTWVNSILTYGTMETVKSTFSEYQKIFMLHNYSTLSTHDKNTFT